MATRNDGIQQLLQAEKMASDKVNEARKRKARRLKQAKQEALSEIEAEKAYREKEFRAHEEKVLGSRTDVELQINRNTEATLVRLSQNVQDNRERALEHLLQAVCDIKPQLHINYKPINA